MSYDVSIGDDWFNYTYNVSKLFYDHMDGGLKSLDGMTGKEAAIAIDNAFSGIADTKNKLWVREIVGEPKFCAQYDSPNGWGSTVGALIFLANIMGACARNPRKKVRVS